MSSKKLLDKKVHCNMRNMQQPNVITVLNDNYDKPRSLLLGSRYKIDFFIFQVGTIDENNNMQNVR